MTRLLVSVRSLEEALDAFEAGADLIDLKEPSAGSLGRVPPSVAVEVAARLGGLVPLSMALGELADDACPSDALNGRDPWEVPAGIAFAKLGLAGCAATHDWRARWQAAVRRLPASCAPVAVIYADWQTVRAPPPGETLRGAVELGCRALLIDTCNKQQGKLFEHVTVVQVGRLMAEARSRQLLTVLAGSLTLADAHDALRCRPDFLAVRGAVCDGSREARLVPDKVRHWKNLCGSGELV